MIQNIGNASLNLDPTRTISTGTQKNNLRGSQQSSLCLLPMTPREIILQESIKLIKGIATDLLQAALSALNHSATATAPAGSNTTAGEDDNVVGAEDSTVTPDDSTEDVSTVAQSAPRTNEGLSSFLQRVLKPNKDGDFHEEQLQYGIAGYLLNDKSPGLYTKFQSAYADYEKKSGSRASYEDGVKIALKDLVSKRAITRAEAESISGKSFRAAQLDKDLKTLFDDKGGAGDPTIAVLSAKAAADKVDRTLGRIRRGELTAPARDLDTPSNTKVKLTISTSNSTAANGFLWKPISSSDGNLAILTPADISKNVESVSIYGVDENGEKQLIEQGRSLGISEGERAKFSFNQPGDNYPDGAVVDIKLNDGSVVSKTIHDTEVRVES